MIGPAKPLLVFVEDPGAANFLAPILSRLSVVREALSIYAESSGAAQLEAMGVPYRAAAEMGTAAEAVRCEAPWAVLVGTSENLDTTAFDLIAAARAAGVTSIGGVDGAANADFRFRGRSDDPLMHAPDLLLLTDDLSRKNFDALGFDADRIVVCGHPYYDKVREVGRALDREGRDALRPRLFPAAGARPIVVFLAEISGGLNPEQFARSDDYTLSGRGKARGRTEIILEEFLDAVREMAERPYLVLRPHPKSTDAELGSYYANFDHVSRGREPLETVFAADLIVGMSTSLLVEATLLGRPTLSIVPRALERDWLPTTAMGITPCITRRADIAPALVEGLKGADVDIDGLFPSGAAARAVASLVRIRERCG